MNQHEYYSEYSQSSRKLALKQYVYRAGSYHYNWHPEMELLLVLKGHVEVCSSGRTAALGVGDLIGIGANVGHATFSPAADGVLLLLRLDMSCLRDFFPNSETVDIQINSEGQDLNLPVFRQIRQNMADMMLNPLQNAGQRIRFEKSLFALLDTLVNVFPVSEVRRNTLQIKQNQNEVVSRLVRIIDENYHQKIGLEELGRRASYHPSYVSQIFKSCLGINYMDYLTRIRMREAIKDLRLSDDSISDIALRNGFPDVKSFNQHFRQSFGKTPGEFRRQLTPQMRSIDQSFKQQYVRRDDAEITPLIEGYAAGPQVLCSPPDGFDREVRQQERLQQLQLQLRGLQSTLDQLTSDF